MVVAKHNKQEAHLLQRDCPTVHSTCYPHMPISKVWIYRLLFVILSVCVFVRLRISEPRIKLDATPFWLPVPPSLLTHHFYTGCPSYHNPPNLRWLGQQALSYTGLHNPGIGFTEAHRKPQPDNTLTFGRHAMLPCLE